MAVPARDGSLKTAELWLWVKTGYFCVSKNPQKVLEQRAVEGGVVVVTLKEAACPIKHERGMCCIGSAANSATPFLLVGRTWNCCWPGNQAYLD